MIESKDLLKHLEALTQLDVDAVHAYTAAIDKIDLVEVKGRLIEFRGDHERHVSDLSMLLERLGGEAPKQTPDFKGFLIQGFTALKSMISNESALKAMKTNEQLTNKEYAQMLELTLPGEVLEVVQRNRDDERRHLEYITQCIEERVWDRPHRTVA